MLTIRYQSVFKKDYKRVLRRGYDIQLMKAVIQLLAEQIPLSQKYKDHGLTGDYAGFRECHITPDWLLVLVLSRTGTHSDLF